MGTGVSGDSAFNTNATIYAWNDGSERGNVYVRDGYAFRISFFSVDNGPTFEQVVGGLGEPKFIDRNHHIAHLNVITFDLYYPNLGILVSGASEMKRKDMMYTSDGASARLLRTVPVDVIHCYTPGSIETILTDVFLHPNEDSQQQMELLKPWPGFDAMVRLDY